MSKKRGKGVRGSIFAAGHQAFARGILRDSEVTVRSIGTEFYNANDFPVLYWIGEFSKYYGQNQPKKMGKAEVDAVWREAKRKLDRKNEIVIATTPEWVDKDYMNRLDGGILHEAFHSLFTTRGTKLNQRRMLEIMENHYDPEIRYDMRGQSLKIFWNVFEDAFIEREGMKEFKGALYKLNTVHQMVWDREKYARQYRPMGAPMVDKNGRPMKDDDGEPLVFPKGHPRAGEPLMSMSPLDHLVSYIRDRIEHYLTGAPLDEYHEDIVRLVDVHFKDVIQNSDKVETTYDAFDLAMESLAILDDLVDKTEQHRQQSGQGQGQPQQGQGQGQSGQGQSGQGQGQSQSGGQQSQSGGSGSSSQQSGSQQSQDGDDSGSDGGGSGDDQNQGQDGDDEKDGSGSGSDENADEEGDEESEGSGGNEGDEDSDEDGDDSKSGSGDEDGDEDGDESDGDDADGDEEDGEGAGEDDGDEEEGDDSEGASDSTDGADDDPHGGDPHDRGREKEVGDDESEGANETEDSLDDIEESLINDICDPTHEHTGMEDISSALKQEWNKQVSTEAPPSVMPFSRDIDTVVKVEADNTDREAKLYNEVAEKVKNDTVYIRPRMLSFFRGQKKSRMRHRQEKGRRLSSRSISEVVYKDRPRPFMTKEMTDRRDAVVSMVLDESSSMGSRSHTARQILATLALTVGELRIPMEILGFTTNGQNALREYLRQHPEKDNWDYKDDVGKKFSRTCGVRYRVFREFDEPFNINSYRKLVHTRASGYTPLPDAIEFAAKRLVPRNEDQKIMFVVSDGYPCYVDTHWSAEDYLEIMKRQVAELKKDDVEVLFIGVGTGADFVTRYPNSVCIESMDTFASQMAAFLFDQMRRILMKR